MFKKLKLILIIFTLLIPIISGCNKKEPLTATPTASLEITSTPTVQPSTTTIDKDGYYTSKEDVALYIHLYNTLPNNYITKADARELGWDPSLNNLWEVTDKMSIGGDIFQNREKLLPIKENRIYYECDIDYDGKSRNAKRIVFSNDGWIYYTSDHYATFILMYEGD